MNGKVFNVIKKQYLKPLFLAILLINISISALFVPKTKALVTATAPPVAIASPAGVNGYTLLDANGNIYNFGTAYLGGAGANRVAPFVAMAYTPSGKGYALLDSQGHVYNFGDSQYMGNAPADTVPYVAIAYKPGTFGYTILDATGHIFNFGTDYLGGGDDRMTYTALAYTPSGMGYAMMDSTGDVYNFGDSQYRGGTPANIHTPMRGFAYKPGTYGYTELDATGAIYNFGTDYLGGSPQGSSNGFVGMVYTPSGMGYTMVSSTGQIYNFGDAQYFGGFDAIGPPVTPGGPGIVGNIFADSTSVACAPGTIDVGIQDGYHGGTLTKIRLCALTNLTSSSAESTPGSAYYIKNANGLALVNSRVSAAVFAMVNDAKNSHISVSANSSFRTMAHQKALCQANAHCKKGKYDLVAKPGTSNHQMGLAIDFNGTNVTGGGSCGARAKDPNSAIWSWLYSNASKYGYHQYSAESWHWDPTTGANMC